MSEDTEMAYSLGRQDGIDGTLNRDNRWRGDPRGLQYLAYIRGFTEGNAIRERPFSLEAEQFGPNSYVVRPVGAVGTCGWINNKPWQARYISATSPKEAIAKAQAPLTGEYK